MTGPQPLNPKLTPLAPPRGWQRRPALAAAAASPVVTLVAGPGSGKSVALLDLAAHAEARGARVVWYQPDPDDVAPATVFRDLVAGVASHIPDFGRGLLPLLGRADVPPEVLWRRFFEDLAAYNLPGLVLQIDDAHALLHAGPELLAGLAYFLANLPPRVAVHLAARKRLPLPSYKLQAKRVLAALGAGDLRLGPDEARAYLAATAADAEALAAEAEALEGWPLGLALLARAGGAGGRARVGLSRYVAREVFGAQPADRQAFMLRAAGLAPLTAEACRQVLLVPDAAERLEALEADQLLERAQEPGVYRFPAYLRDFLLGEVDRRVSDSERRELNRRAAAHHVHARRPEAALPHLIAADAWPEAVALFRELFPALLADGRHAAAERWLGSLAQDPAPGPWLAYWRGVVLERHGENAEAYACFERAATAFREAEDLEGELKATVRLATMTFRQEDASRFGRLLARALAILPHGRPEDQADVLLLRSMAAEQRGDLALYAECNEAVGAIAIDGNVEVAQCACIAALNLFTHALHRGDLDRARRHADRASTLAEAWRFEPYRVYAGFLRAHVDLVEGRVEDAGAFLRRPPAGWETLLDWHDLGCAHTVLALYHEAQGDLAEADAAVEAAMAVFRGAGYDEGTKLPLERACWLALRRGEPERVEALVPAVDEAGGIHSLALRVPRARARDLRGEADRALAEHAVLAQEFASMGCALHLARVKLHEAAALRRAGRPEAAAARATALAEVEARGWGFLLAEDPALRADLADAKAAAPPAAQGLEIRCFGGFEVIRDGVRLTEWPRRKAKALLAALALHPRGLAPADLAAALDEHGDDAAIAMRVQTNVSALRRLLEPGLAKGKASAYVDQHEGRYRLRRDAVGFLDTDAFSRLAAEGDRLAALDPDAAAAAYDEALSHVRGTLLEDPYLIDLFAAEREGFTRRAVAALRFVHRHRRAAGDGAAAEAALRRAAALATFDEDVCLDRMAFHFETGEPERVKQAYWDFRRALKASLGLDPDPEVDAAFARYVAARDLSGA